MIKQKSKVPTATEQSKSEIRIPAVLTERALQIVNEAQQKCTQIMQQANNNAGLVIEGFLLSKGENPPEWTIEENFTTLKKIVS